MKYKGRVSQERANAALARARAAKQREIEAHRHAIDLQEGSAERQERMGHPELAALARQRAQSARDALALAIVERDQAEEGRSSG